MTEKFKTGDYVEVKRDMGPYSNEEGGVALICEVFQNDLYKVKLVLDRRTRTLHKDSLSPHTFLKKRKRVDDISSIELEKKSFEIVAEKLEIPIGSFTEQGIVIFSLNERSIVKTIDGKYLKLDVKALPERTTIVEDDDRMFGGLVMLNDIVNHCDASTLIHILKTLVEQPSSSPFGLIVKKQLVKFEKLLRNDPDKARAQLINYLVSSGFENMSHLTETTIQDVGIVDDEACLAISTNLNLDISIDVIRKAIQTLISLDLIQKCSCFVNKFYSRVYEILEAGNTGKRREYLGAEWSHIDSDLFKICFSVLSFHMGLTTIILVQNHVLKMERQKQLQSAFKGLIPLISSKQDILKRCGILVIDYSKHQLSELSWSLRSFRFDVSQFSGSLPIVCHLDDPDALFQNYQQNQDKQYVLETMLEKDVVLWSFISSEIIPEFDFCRSKAPNISPIKIEVKISKTKPIPINFDEERL